MNKKTLIEMTNLKYSGWIFQAVLIMMQVPQSTATQK